jgi:hypothetical protein
MKRAACHATLFLTCADDSTADLGRRRTSGTISLVLLLVLRDRGRLQYPAIDTASILSAPLPSHHSYSRPTTSFQTMHSASIRIAGSRNLHTPRDTYPASPERQSRLFPTFPACQHLIKPTSQCAATD